jgi:disulfide bond formation protein DsbB
MEIFTNILNKTLSLATILLQIFVVLTTFFLILKKKDKFLSFLAKYYNQLSSIIVLSGIVFSLIYSLVIGFPPCILCIIQRWFLYPQIIFYGLLIYKEIKYVKLIPITLSIIGFVVSLYHNWIDFGGSSLGICDTGEGISCTQRFVYEFGYITIPMMTLTVFATLIILFVNKKIQNK